MKAIHAALAMGTLALLAACGGSHEQKAGSHEGQNGHTETHDGQHHGEGQNHEQHSAQAVAQWAEYKAVIGPHDEAMAEMGNLMNYKTKAEAAAAAANSDADKEKYNTMAQRLANAHEGMMVWMRQFNSNYEGMEEAEIKEYLNGQLQPVTEMATEVQAALDEAKKALDSE